MIERIASASPPDVRLWPCFAGSHGISSRDLPRFGLGPVFQGDDGKAQTDTTGGAFPQQDSVCRLLKDDSSF
jgi:hypothetical protein